MDFDDIIPVSAWVCEACGCELDLDDPNRPGPHTFVCVGLLCEACELDACFQNDLESSEENV